MELMLRRSAQEFLDVTVDYRAAHPLETNVLSTVATSVARGEVRYEPCWWWTVSEMYRVIGAGMRTGPHHLFLGPMSHDAATLLGQGATLEDPTLPGVTASPRVTEAFRAAYRSAGRMPVQSARQLLYEVDELNMVDVTGSFRPTTAADAELVATWLAAFHADATPSEPLGDEADRRARATEGHLFVWDDGGPVALAGYRGPIAGPGGTLARIGPVYTPPAHRRHGYGAAVTASLTARLRDEGHRVMLYTDAANPTSNSVYRRIGFRQVAELIRTDWVDLDDGSTPTA